ncbi:MAG: hypothetical protein U0T02_04960 [Solirubrobacteraceae bacterium]
MTTRSRLAQIAVTALVACGALSPAAGASPGKLSVAPSCLPRPSTPFHFEAHRVAVIGDTAHLFALGGAAPLFPEARISDLRTSSDQNFTGDVSGTAELRNVTQPGTYELRLYVAPQPSFGESAIGSIRVGGCPPPAAQLSAMIAEVRSLGLCRAKELRLVLPLRLARSLIRLGRPRFASVMLRHFESVAGRVAGDAAAALRAESAAVRAQLN